MSPVAILLLSTFTMAVVSGQGIYSGYYNKNNNRGGGGYGGGGNGRGGNGGGGHGGGGHGGGGNGGGGYGGGGNGGGGNWGGGYGGGGYGGGGNAGGGYWSNKWSYLNTQQIKCFEPVAVEPSLLYWFFALADGVDLSIPLMNLHYKLSFAEIFLGRPAHSWWELSQMDLKVKYNLQFETYYLLNYTAFGNMEVIINCTLVEVEGSSGSCVPVQGASSHGTNLTLLNPASAWAVYQNETLGIVGVIACLGDMDTGTASWLTYSLYDDEIDPATWYDICQTMSDPYGLSCI